MEMPFRDRSFRWFSWSQCRRSETVLRICPEISESTFERIKIWIYNRTLIPYIVMVINVEPIRERFCTVAPFLDERGRRLVAAAEAFAAGYGGIAAVAMATGMAPS